MVIKKIKHKDATGNLHEYDIGAEAKNVTQDKDRQFVTAEEKEAWNKKQDGDGDVSSLSVKFQQASTRSNIKTGEKLNVIFGKIAKWFADFKSHVFLDLVQNATTKDTTRAVSAAVAAELQKQIDSLNSALGTFSYWGTVVSPEEGNTTLTMSKAMRNDHMYLILMRRLNGLEDTYPPYAYLLFMRSKNYALTTIGEESEVVDRKISNGKLTLTFKNIQWTRMTVYEVM